MKKTLEWATLCKEKLRPPASTTRSLGTSVVRTLHNPAFRTHQYQPKQISGHNSCTHNPTALMNMSTDQNTFQKIIKNSTVFYHVSPKPLRTTNLYVILSLNFLVLHKPQSHCTLQLYTIQSFLFPSNTNASST